jgi:hypothetical protein
MADLRGFLRADARNRTGDPFITSEVLYQLSYVGVCRDFPDFPTPGADFGLHGGCKILVGRRSGQGSGPCSGRRRSNSPLGAGAPVDDEVVADGEAGGG